MRKRKSASFAIEKNMQQNISSGKKFRAKLRPIHFSTIYSFKRELILVINNTIEKSMKNWV